MFSVVIYLYMNTYQLTQLLISFWFSSKWKSNLWLAKTMQEQVEDWVQANSLLKPSICMCTTWFNIIQVEFWVLSTECISAFYLVLNKQWFFLKQHWLVGFCSGYIMGLLWGTNWICVYFRRNVDFKRLTVHLVWKGKQMFCHLI